MYSIFDLSYVAADRVRVNIVSKEGACNRLAIVAGTRR